MRNLIFALAALFVLALGVPAMAAMFKDVPTDHWAYEAIDYLQQQGLVEGYPDGTFGGNRTFTRYEMAMVIARIYSKLEDMVGNYDTSRLDEIQAQLDRLANEFKDELAELGVRLDKLEGQVNQNTDDIAKLKSMIKDSIISGYVRYRTGAYVTTGTVDWSNDFGHEQVIGLHYGFMPEENVKFDLSLTSAEAQGNVGTGFIPGVNNESGAARFGNPPFGNMSQSSSFVIDEAKATIGLKQYTNSLGDGPTFTVGRQYFSQGEFGLAGDNGYRSDFGYRFDTGWGDNHWGAYLAAYRVEGVGGWNPYYNPASLSNGSSVVNVFDNDDMLLAGLRYNDHEGKIPGHAHSFELAIDGTPEGYGAEVYVDVSGNAEIPWWDNEWFNGIRAEWNWTPTNVSDINADDFGLADMSAIVELDVYNDGRTLVKLAGASIAQLEGLPVYANVDNDPFSEWDFTVNGVGDSFNMSREGKNYFPADFEGIGVTAEHTFRNDLYGKVTWYTGSRINAFFDDRPGLLKFNFRYPFEKNASLGLDIITAGEYNNLEDAITLVRGEFLLHF
jgi:hypothetical protein